MVAWGFKFWVWIMNKGVTVTDYDLFDIKAWVAQGEKGLKQSMSEKEFEYIDKHTKDLHVLRKDVQKVSQHPNFTYHQQKPTLELLSQSILKGNPCEVVLDSHTLDRVEGFALHRVVVLDVTDSEIIFHDPREVPRPHRRESINHFQKAWLKAVDGPELCVYSKG